MITYRELVNKSQKVEKLLLEKGIIDFPIKGRFKYYQNMISSLRDNWEAKTLNQFWNSFKGDEMGFALKELQELSDIFGEVTNFYDSLSAVSKKFVKEKIPIILSGTNFTVDENSANSAARNYQFELRLASKFIHAQYKQIDFAEHPDLLVTVDNKPYAFECKRILGNPENKIQSNIETGLKQLEKNKDKYFSGVIALDLSPQYEQGKNWLIARTREDANSIALDSLEKVANTIHSRIYKVREAATNGYLAGIILNLSTVYVISSNNELGWVQEIGVLVFDKENPSKALQFMNDIQELQKYAIP